MAAQFTYDPEAEAYYFAPLGAKPGPYYTQRHVDAILDIAFDGTLAGVELIDRVPPPPCLASQPSPAATVETMAEEILRVDAEPPEASFNNAEDMMAYLNAPQRSSAGTAEPDIEARIAVLSDALKSISKNTCCGNCREAANVARSALAAYVGLARESALQSLADIDRDLIGHDETMANLNALTIRR